MKKAMHGFYSPSPSEFKELWGKAIFVLDTNVLLNLYRYPTDTRNELLGVLELLKERIWIPHQVALEFQRNRLSTIATERSSIEDILNECRGTAEKLKRKVEKLQIEKRNLGLDPTALFAGLDEATVKLAEAIAAVHTAQSEVATTDEIRDRLDKILEGRVGPGFADQKELDAFLLDGEQRYAAKIPPGFEDAGKDKNPQNATFVFQNVIYKRSFGDLILWKQLIAHLNALSQPSVIMVTGDTKEDWWWREQGKTIGPHPELVFEMKRTARVHLFWMYNSSQFVTHANEYVSANVSEKAVLDIKKSDEEGTKKENRPLEDSLPHGIDWGSPLPIKSSISNKRSSPLKHLARFIGVLGYTVEFLPGHIGLLVQTDSGMHLVDFVPIHFSRPKISRLQIEQSLRKCLELAELLRPAGFTVVAVDLEKNSWNIEPEAKVKMHEEIQSALHIAPCGNLVLGEFLATGFSLNLLARGPNSTHNIF